MKDPLTPQPTPYEILGLDRSAGPAEIDRAFKMGLVKKGNPSKLTGARKLLERPVDRALLDLFHYDPDALGRLSPDPRQSLGSLEVGGRGATAEAWEEQLRDSFPDYGMAHALAILWYWWAVHASEALTQQPSPDQSSTAPLFDALWESAIGYWAMVITSDDFWTGQKIVPADVVQEVRRRLAEQLPGDLQRFAQHHRDAGQNELAERYRQLELVLATEVKTAKALAGAGFQTSEGALWCGTLMLRRLKLLESIRQQVDEDLASHPSDETLQSLARALSPYFRIAALIERKQPQLALDAIEALPETEKESREVRDLKARALFQRGEQEESLDHVYEALDLWEAALDCQPSPELEAQIRETVRDSCQPRAAALQAKRRNEAIKILDRAVSFAASEELEETLALLLTARGVETVVKAQKVFEDEPGVEGVEKLKRAVKRGLKDLRRATKLGSSKAKEQAEVAEALLAQLEGGGVPAGQISPKVQALLAEANEMAGKGETLDLFQATGKLREALNEVEPGSPAAEMIRKNLSATLTALGVSMANMVGEQLKGGSVSASKVEEAAAGFQMARTNLSEALELDRTNQHARDNLQSLDDLMDRLGISRESGPAAKPTSKRKAKVSAEDERSWAVGFIPVALFFASVLVTVKATPMADALTGREPDNWFTAVRDFSTAGSLGVNLAWILTSVFVISILFILPGSWGAQSAANLLGGICFGRWRNKNLLAKLLEIGLYAFAALFVTGAVAHTRGQLPATDLGPEVELPVEAVAAPAGEETDPQPPETPETLQPEAPTDLPSSAPPPVPAIDLEDLSWLGMDAVPVETVTALLQGVTALDEEEMREQVDRVMTEAGQATESGRAAATLLKGAAAERSGEVADAQAAYHELLAFVGEESYTTTAQMRLDLLGADGEDALEEVYEGLAWEPGPEVWAPVGGQWERTTANQAALHGLMEIRSDHLSIRFLNRIKRSTFVPAEYAYLQVFLIFLIGLSLFQFYLLQQRARLSILAPKLRPEALRIQRSHPKDAVKQGKAMAKLFERHGASQASGCTKPLLDLGFLTLFYFLFRSYAPQLHLDGSRFFWATDLIHRDLGILCVWVVSGVLFVIGSPRVIQPGGIVPTIKTAAFLSLLAAVAWFLDWPAYLMVFWALLWLWMALIHAILVAYQAQRG